MKFLYRGVSEAYYNSKDGKLIPKSSEPFTSFMYAGNEYSQAGRGLMAGSSPVNEVVKHEYKQKGFPTSGISTTPFVNRARFYATSGGKCKSGYLYKIDRSLLIQYGVTEYIVNNLIPVPSIPEDDEVILVAADFGPIPDQVIASIEHFTLEKC